MTKARPLIEARGIHLAFQWLSFLDAPDVDGALLATLSDHERAEWARFATF